MTLLRVKHQKEYTSSNIFLLQGICFKITPVLGGGAKPTTAEIIFPKIIVILNFDISKIKSSQQFKSHPRLGMRYSSTILSKAKLK